MTAYKDDETISNDCLLLRRIPSKPNLNIVWDGNKQCYRPSSASFENHPNGSPMSIVLSDALDESNRPYESVLQGHDSGFSLAAISAGLARQCSQLVTRDPLPEEPAHGLVVGEKPKSVCRKLAKNAQWIIEPEL